MIAGENSIGRGSPPRHQQSRLCPMSTQQPLSDVADITRTEPCNHEHCSEGYIVGRNDHSPFCSGACKRRATALGIFKDINHDRRFCSNCYHQIREIEEQGRFMRSSKVRTRVYYQPFKHLQRSVYTKDPDDPTAFFQEDDNRQHATALATPTKHTVRGAGSRLSLSDPSRHTYQTADDPTPKAVCKCGCMHHTTTIRPIELDEMMEYAGRLADIVEKLHAEGNHRPALDRDVFLDEIRARKSDPQNNGTPDQRIFVNALAEALDV